MAIKRYWDSSTAKWWIDENSAFASTNKYKGVIDFGVTRDANWTTVYTVADVATTSGGSAPGVSGNDRWGSEARQQSVVRFLKGYSSADGYIDNYVTDHTGVYASSAELYGNARMNAAGGVFDQTRARGYDAGTNYREGGLKHIDRGGIIGQSGGYYFDEAGQYALDANGNLTYNGNGYFSGNTSAIAKEMQAKYGNSKNPGGIYDDWNQHGLVTTGLDLIAYTTNFNTSLSALAAISGEFTVLGQFLGIFINGNLIEQSMLGLTEHLYGTGDIVGEYAFFLDLAWINPLFWNADGVNDISFMVKTVTPYELGLAGNPVGVYNREAGFNYFSANIAYGKESANVSVATPEPATLAIICLGLVGLGLTRRKRKSA